MDSRESILNRIKYAEKAIPQVNKDGRRQGFHLMPPVGWLNDPNGLCQNNGEYNVFFQYSPTNVNGGEKFWGWYKGESLIKWKYMGVPLAPDTEWDKNGVYSGSGLAEDGKVHLFYTGNVKHPGDYDYITDGRDSNVVYANDSDFSKKLLLTNEDYPADYTCHIRDPKVWKEDKYYMALGGRKLSDKGTLLIYESENIDKGWRFLKEVTTKEPFGYMWECPDVFKLGDVTVISVSPQGLKSEEYRYQNIYQSGYFLTDKSIFDDFTPAGFEEWDYGFDFYAPQTFEDEKGRRILIGWVGMPDSDNVNPTTEKGWQNCLTVPRVLKYKNGKVYQTPASELEALRTNERTVKPWEAFETERADIIVTNIKGDFEASIRESVLLKYEDGVFEMIMDSFGRSIRKLRLESLESVRILLDRSVVEVYINDGEYVMTTMYYTDSKKCSISCGSINVFDMNSMEVDYEKADCHR